MEDGYCSVPSCERPSEAKTLCCAHYLRARQGRDLMKPLRETKPRRDRKDVVTYSRRHGQLRRQLGPPTEWRCLQCGERATHWALAPWAEFFISEQGLRMSMRNNDYVPYCTSCHFRTDRTVRRILAIMAEDRP